MITSQQIRAAIHRNEFVFHYQPKVSLITGEVCGAEALIRWRRSEGPLVRPSEFIPVAATSPLITEITSHMFGRLLSDLSSFDSEGGAQAGPVSFNISARDLQEDAFAIELVEALQRSELKSDDIELEITENDALTGGEPLMHNLSLLQGAGITIAMDDFGVGYSSIDSLSVWPFSTIKLDQGLIGRMLTSKKTAQIVQSTIRMAHELNLNVVAEGVESQGQYDFLMNAGCQMVQGYLISRPMPLDEFQQFVRSNSRWRGFPLGLVHMAIIDHVQWRRELVHYVIENAHLPQNCLRRRHVNCPEQPCMECKLGRWYYGEGTHFRGQPMYEELEAPHRELHNTAARLVQQVHDGARITDIADGLQLLKSYSVELIGLLESLEDHAIAQLRQLKS